MFYFEKINGKKVMKSDMLSGLEHFFTTRESVIKSKEPEMQDIIKQNKKDICEYLHIDVSDMISPSQTHTDNIAVAHVELIDYPDTDAVILPNFEQCVYLNFADCTPVILYDKNLNIAAIAHAGWRGTAKKIAPKTVLKMVNDFGSYPEDITAVIGPAISLCCYNVGIDVAEELRATVHCSDDLIEIKDGNIYVDLKRINARQLSEIGVKEIDVCEYCTCCDNDLFFSYRKEHATTNRHSAIIKLN